jgi:autonomous glycyl radical cofactor GrcA
VFDDRCERRRVLVVRRVPEMAQVDGRQHLTVGVAVRENGVPRETAVRRPDLDPDGL